MVGLKEEAIKKDSIYLDILKSDYGRIERQ